MRTSTRWLVSAGLLGAGAALQAVAVRMAWLPCAGQSIDAFSPECLRAMDGTNPLPVIIRPEGLVLPEILSLGAMAALSLAWLVVLPSIRTGRRARVALAAPSLLALAAVLTLALGAPVEALLVTIDAASIVALLVLVAARDLEPDGHRVRYAVVLAGATAMSFGNLMLEYSVAISLSEADWDVPPHTGYLTVVGLGLAAAVVAGWDRVGRAYEHLARSAQPGRQATPRPPDGRAVGRSRSGQAPGTDHRWALLS
ncbi:hypothetical protein [Actinotalea sp. K2]|uniref:hypothetical protein n=1 Tax=Actinotalea sp. K2 TaxID=2939438 RepID=UPI0020178321|nr:hypothetical protein [Actinotalea sp. K2]MCL3860994.1 hypothetical protein [Actinotalea sp. K2]